MYSLPHKYCQVLGPIAQSVEQRTFNPWVDGSSPSGPTHIEIGFSPLLVEVKSLGANFSKKFLNWFHFYCD